MLWRILFCCVLCIIGKSIQKSFAVVNIRIYLYVYLTLQRVVNSAFGGLFLTYIQIAISALIRKRKMFCLHKCRKASAVDGDWSIDIATREKLISSDHMLATPGQLSLLSIPCYGHSGSLLLATHFLIAGSGIWFRNGDMACFK